MFTYLARLIQTIIISALAVLMTPLALFAAPPVSASAENAPKVIINGWKVTIMESDSGICAPAGREFRLNGSVELPPGVTAELHTSTQIIYNPAQVTPLPTVQQVQNGYTFTLTFVWPGNDAPNVTGAHAIATLYVQGTSTKGAEDKVSYWLRNPCVLPTATPTSTPTSTPTAQPTATPTSVPTARPTSTPTAQPTARPTSTPISNKRRYYLPIITGRQPMPDLTIKQASLDGIRLQITITNKGDGAAKEGFWVVAYQHPTTPTKGARMNWNDFGRSYVSWWIAADKQPLAPGASLTITNNDALAKTTGTLPTSKPGTRIYLHIDAYGRFSTNGEVMELDELDSAVNNNIAYLTTVPTQPSPRLPRQ